jgi:hypothetical protein
MMNTKDNMDTNFSAALLKYLDACVADYKSWQDADAAYNDEVSSKIRSDMFEDYKNKLEFDIGKKYIKVISGRSAHSFIVLEDDGKFKKGDILKTASWNAPAKNFARGNIFGEYSIRWTGA